VVDRRRQAEGGGSKTLSRLAGSVDAQCYDHGVGLNRIVLAVLTCAGCQAGIEAATPNDADKVGSNDADVGSNDGSNVDSSPVVDAPGTADSTPDASPAWSPRAPLPLPRTDHGVAAVAGKVYAFGGYSGSMLARVDAYDPATDMWTQKADMPEPRRAFASGVLGGKIYVAGGASFTDPNNTTFLPSTRVYDPATDTWSPLAPCPLGTSPNSVYGNQYVGGGVLGNAFYVFEALDSTTNMHVYDPQTDTWTTNSAAAFGYSKTSSAAIADVLYVFATDEYPPEWAGNLWSWYSSSDTWVIGKSLGQNALRSAVFTMNGKLYSAGGVAGDPNTYQTTSAVWEYDPATAAWTQHGALGVAREYAGAAVLNGQVYVVGGDVPAAGQPAVPSAVVEVATY
jgi:N-acetylneuraminic acid mutarotase